MALILHNTLTGGLDPFVPVDPGVVRMYVCGPTVYDHAHIGHARSAVIYDVLVRYLRFRGYRVETARNFTDIDDKIVAHAALQGRSFEAVAERFIRSWRNDMDFLGVQPCDHEPRVTRHVEDIVGVIGKLLEKGHAYRRGANVYFRVRSVPDYGLMGRASGRQEEGAVSEGRNKEDPRDFALWKGVPGSEPAWDSPWGRGRPGWHVECAVMARKALGVEFDIHGGGSDLVFPHHENERALSKALSGTDLARYWVHHALVTSSGRKLSRSENTPCLVRDLAGSFSGASIRLFILSTHYRRQLDFTESRMREAAAALKRLEHLAARWPDVAEKPPVQVMRSESILVERFCSAMDADLNVPEALHALFSAARSLSRALDEAHARGTLRPGTVSDLAAFIVLAQDVLGLLPAETGGRSTTEMSNQR